MSTASTDASNRLRLPSADSVHRHELEPQAMTTMLLKPFFHFERKR